MKSIYETQYSFENSSSFDFAQNDDSSYFEDESDLSQPTDWHRFLPPGFRTFKIWKMIIALFGYFMIFSVGKTYLIDPNMTPLKGLIECLTEVIAMILVVLFACNYLDAQSHVPFCKDENNLIRFIAVCITCFVIIVAVIAVMLIVENLLL